MSRTISAPMFRIGAREAVVEPPDSDARLIERWRGGDLRAFEALFRRHQAYVYNISLGMLCNSEDAADVTQEAFLRLHRCAKTFRGDSTFTTWLYRVTVNLCITEMRRRSRHRYEFLDEVAHDEQALLTDEATVCPEEAVAAEADRELVRRVLRTLPPDYRAVMVLRHFQQLAYEEIAEVLGLTLSQVKTRLFRARRMFKDRYEAFEGKSHAV